MMLKNYDLNKFLNFVNFCKQNRFLIDSSFQESYNNDIELYKNGTKIKIKKENIGSFTRYCGGNVTEECIKRGKNSPSKSIRKKAIFALNSRRWKH